MSEKRQSTGANAKMNQMLGLFNKDFKGVTIKMIQQSITNSVDTKEKTKISQQRNRSCKKEPTGNYRTEKSNI